MSKDSDCTEVDPRSYISRVEKGFKDTFEPEDYTYTLSREARDTAVNASRRYQKVVALLNGLTDTADPEVEKILSRVRKELYILGSSLGELRKVTTETCKVLAGRSKGLLANNDPAEEKV